MAQEIKIPLGQVDPGSLQLVAWDVPGIKIHLGQVDPGTRDDLTLGQHGPHLLIA